jgi:signal transduction histidine kinase
VLTTTKLYLDLATTDAGLRDELIRKSLQNINDVIQEIRHLSRSLMDPSIGDLGLLASIDDLIGSIHLTKQLQIRLEADEAVEDCLDANQKLTVFRIIQESLNNVLRHAKATEVRISILKLNNQLLLTIRDNGIGFGAGVTKKGAGLKNIQNRIYLINGSLNVKSHPGEGCTIQLQFPIKTNN